MVNPTRFFAQWKKTMILQGRNIILLVGGVAIAAAKSCDLNVSADAIPVASPSDGTWEDFIPGRKSWKASCSHLVTSITDPAAMVGTVVTLKMQVYGELGLPFSIFVDNVTIQQEALSGEPMFIAWDKTAKKFVGGIRQGISRIYYDQWNGSSAYNSAAAGTLFYSDNIVYKKTATDLVPEALQGSAIVREWRITGTLGNLAQGSFQFQGKGALAVSTT